MSNKNNIVTEFREFIKDTSRLKEMDPYELLGDFLIVEIFSYKPTKSEKKLYLSAGSDLTTDDLKQPLTFGVGKVLGVGHLVEHYEVGDIVAIKDFEVATITNPEWVIWNNHPGNKSNAEKVGVEPTKTISNFSRHISKVFVTRKIGDDTNLRDVHTVQMPMPYILGKIKDPNAIIQD